MYGVQRHQTHAVTRLLAVDISFHPVPSTRRQRQSQPLHFTSPLQLSEQNIPCMIRSSRERRIIGDEVEGRTADSHGAVQQDGVVGDLE